MIPAAFRTTIVFANETKFASGEPVGRQYAQDGFLDFSFNKTSEKFSDTSIYGTIGKKDYINSTGVIQVNMELTPGIFLNQIFYWLFGSRGSIRLGDFEDSSYDINFYGNFPSFITEVTMPDNYTSYRLNGCFINNFSLSITSDSPIITCNFSAKFAWLKQDIPIPRSDLIDEHRLPNQPFRTAVYVDSPSPTLSFDRSNWKEMATDLDLVFNRNVEYKAFDYHGVAKGFSINRTEVNGNYRAYAEDFNPWDFIDNEERSLLFSSGSSDSSGSLNFFMPSVKFRNPTVNPYNSGLVFYSIPFDALPRYGSGKLLELRARLTLSDPDSSFVDAGSELEVNFGVEVSSIELTANTEIWVVYDATSLPSDFINMLTTLVNENLRKSLLSIYGSNAQYNSKVNVVASNSERFLQWLRSDGGSGPAFSSKAIVIGFCDESTSYFAGSVTDPVTGSPTTNEFDTDLSDLENWLSTLTTEQFIGVLFPSNKLSEEHKSVANQFEYLNDYYTPLNAYPSLSFEPPVSLIQPPKYYFEKIRESLLAKNVKIPENV